MEWKLEAAERWTFVLAFFPHFFHCHQSQKVLTFHTAQNKCCVHYFIPPVVARLGFVCLQMWIRVKVAGAVLREQVCGSGRGFASVLVALPPFGL